MLNYPPIKTNDERIREREQLKAELEQQIKNKNLQKELEKARDLYHGLKVLNTHKTQSFWTRNNNNSIDSVPYNLRQSLPTLNIDQTMEKNRNSFYQQNNNNYNSFNNSNNNNQAQQLLLQQQNNNPQHMFQKTGNSVLQSKYASGPNPSEELIMQNYQNQNQQQQSNQQQQTQFNNTDNNFNNFDQDKSAFMTGHPYHQHHIEPNQLIDENLEY